MSWELIPSYSPDGIQGYFQKFFQKNASKLIRLAVKHTWGQVVGKYVTVAGHVT